MKDLNNADLVELKPKEMKVFNGGGPITEGAAWLVGFVVTLAEETAEGLDREFGSAPPTIGYIK